MEKRVYFYVKLRGLPFDVDSKGIKEFLSSLNEIKTEDIVFRYRRDGKFSGLAFVRLNGEED